jgi:hypothetical protein
MLDRAAPGAYVRRDGREGPALMRRPSGAICIIGGWRLVNPDYATNRTLWIVKRGTGSGAGPTLAGRLFAWRLN